MPKKQAKESMSKVDLDLVDRPAKIARLQIDQGEIDDLAKSLAEVKQLQPVKLARKGDRYEIIFGDRRCLAARKLGWHTINAIVVTATDEQIVAERAAENLGRVDLSPIEEAIQYQEMKEVQNINVLRISRVAGKSEGQILTSLKLLNMPKEFIDAIHAKQVSPTVARELFTIPSEDRRSYYLEIAIAHGITQVIAKQWAQECKDALRVKAAGAGEGGGIQDPYESQPVYITCSLCGVPEDVMQAKSVQMCSTCFKQLHKMIDDASKS